jgi:hypothetical protein
MLLMFALMVSLCLAACNPSREEQAAQKACQCMQENVDLLADSTLQQMRGIQDGQAAEGGANQLPQAGATEKVGAIVQRCFKQAGLPNLHGRSGDKSFNRSQFRKALVAECGGIREVVRQEIKQ